MGGHYGSIHVRTADRDRILSIATELADSMKVRMLIGPAINGWVGIYPENNGQDDRVSQQLAQQLDDSLIHLLVHDDDIFAYWFYRDRKLIDSFHSRPGYFGEENRAAEERMTGNPEAFRPLINAKADQLAPLLVRGDDAPVMAYEQLQVFAKLLGITNAVTAYEYLKEGEHDDVKGWRKFVEVPAVAIDDNAKIEPDAIPAVASERADLVARELLFISDERVDLIPFGCASRDGFIAAWPDHVRRTVTFSEYHEPWKKAHSRELDVPTHVTRLAASADGTRVAIAAGTKVCVRDIDPNSGEWNVVADFPETDLAVAVAISADGSLVAHASRKEIVVTALAQPGDMRKVGSFPCRDHHVIAIHPDNRTVAIGGSALGIVRLDKALHRTDLFVGGTRTVDSVSEAIVQSLLAGADLTRIDASQLESYREAVRAQIGKAMEPLADLRDGRAPIEAPVASERVLCVGFSRDGQWFWCGTDAGLRVYAWSQMLANDAVQLPSPAWRFAFAADMHARSVYAIVEERDAPAIVFAGATGRLYRLDLTTGATRELVKLQGDFAIIGLEMSTDGKALGVAARDLKSVMRRQKSRSAWQVWSYPRIRGAFMRWNNHGESEQ